MERLWLLERLHEWGNRESIIWQDASFTYRWLVAAADEWRVRLGTVDCPAGTVVAIDGDYSPRVCALLLALIENGNIIVPLTTAASAQKDEFCGLAQVERLIGFDAGDGWRLEARSPSGALHPLLARLRTIGTPGLVVFSSGSTGESKAIVHDFEPLLRKFKVRRQCLRTITFLLLDHLGGINTLLYALANGGTIVAVEARDPEVVCRTIERHRVELLPTSPTFLNLIMLSEAYKRFDLSSLRLITYGTEPMPVTLLQRLNAVFPGVRFQQTYGLSEFGVLRSKSRESGSLWVKIGGDGFETKVVDGVLWVRGESAMLGYLNAPSPFDAEGWYNTRDVVERDGDYIRFLGRESDVINVGGAKVYPAEVESALLEMDNVQDVAVRGERNAITGQIVVARFYLAQPEAPEALKRRVREFCKERLARYKTPARIEVSGEPLFGGRFKKSRLIDGGEAVARG